MNAGKLNRRVSFYEPSSALDEYGQRKEGQELLAEVSAAVKPISGREKLAAMAYDTIYKYEITVRYQDKFLPLISANRLKIHYGQQIFEVIDAQDWMDKRRFIVFSVREIENG